MAMTKGLFHLFLSSTDVERTIKFYLDSFEGSRVAYQFEIDGNEMCMLNLGNGIELEILKTDSPFPPEQNSRWGHIAIECSDLQGQFDRMVAAGARVKQPVFNDVVLNGREGDPKTYCAGAFLYGPDDEIIELCFSSHKWQWRG